MKLRMKERGGLEGGFAEASADRVSRRVVVVAVLGVGEGVWRQVSIMMFEFRECENDNKRECWKFEGVTTVPGHLKTKVSEVCDIQKDSQLRTRSLIHLPPSSSKTQLWTSRQQYMNPCVAQSSVKNSVVSRTNVFIPVVEREDHRARPFCV